MAPVPYVINMNAYDESTVSNEQLKKGVCETCYVLGEQLEQWELEGIQAEYVQDQELVENVDKRLHGAMPWWRAFWTSVMVLSIVWQGLMLPLEWWPERAYFKNN